MARPKNLSKKKIADSNLEIIYQLQIAKELLEKGVEKLEKANKEIFKSFIKN